MDLTNENYHKNLPKIKQSILNCDFIAIDCEFSGLHERENINQYDTPKQYYEKVRSSSMNFTVMQYGICLFRYDDNLKGFKHQGYNFFIFPTITNKLTPDHRFMCQTSSINFLRSHGFDFNKVFTEGISYLSHAEEARYRYLLAETQKNRSNQNQSPKNVNSAISTADRETVDKIFEKIEEFIVSNEDERELPSCNSYIRKIVYNEAISKLDSRASLTTRRIGDRVVFCVTKWKNRESKEEEEKRKIQEENEELEKCKGFSEVIKCIVESGKLIVGHNMLLDFLHTIDKFLQKLPPDYEEFKSMANCLFGNFVDTKYMSSSSPFKDYFSSTALPNLLDSVKTKPFQIPTIEIEENSAGYDLNSPKEHEAGYDAYITGLCFLAMWNNLGKLFWQNRNRWKWERTINGCIFKDSKRSPNSTEHLKDQSLLAPYKNRLYLMRLLDNNYVCIHLGGIDPIPSRDHILHLTFPKEWKSDNILQLFHSFGGLDNIAWIDNTSAYVSLIKREQAVPALRSLSKGKEFQIISYANRQEQLDGKSQSQLKRKICNNESIVKKRKTEAIEVKTPVKMASKNTYASIAAMSKSPSMSPPNLVSKSKTPKNSPSLVETNKKKFKNKHFQEDKSWE